MSTIVGTAHYRSRRDLENAYFSDTNSALAEGRVLIGKPPIRKGERLLIDKTGRYHIEVNDK